MLSSLESIIMDCEKQNDQVNIENEPETKDIGTSLKILACFLYLVVFLSISLIIPLSTPPYGGLVYLIVNNIFGFIWYCVMCHEIFNRYMHPTVWILCLIFGPLVMIRIWLGSLA